MNQPKKQILLVGNPNVGKSTVFNLLCNKNQKTGNYAGVTVASQLGKYEFGGETVEVVDLPGSYSIYPSSEDEAIFSKFLIEEQKEYSGVVYMLEALSIKRGLLLFQQIQDLGIPILLVVNQIDQAKRRGISLDLDLLSSMLNVKVISTNAKENIGIDTLRKAIFENNFSNSKNISFEIPVEQKGIINKILSQTNEVNQYKVWMLLSSDTYIGKLKSVKDLLQQNEVKCLVPRRLQTQETIRRYQEIEEILKKVFKKKKNYKELLTEKLDRILVHSFWGYIIFAVVLLLIFQSVFFLADIPMGYIDEFFAWLSSTVKNNLPSGPINSLLSNGIIPGIGGVIIFAPQIGILLYFLYLLEDSGYMSRVIFLMDRLLRPFGLNGKSIVPLVSGTACAIPAIMSTRNIENVKERLITIMVTPFMTCSARLPVYSIIIGLVISDKTFFGINYKAIALMAMYLLGFLMSIAAAFFLKKIIKNVGRSYLIMDLPAYKTPLFVYDFKLVMGKVWEFITGAGKIIFLVSIVIWFFSYFGPTMKTKKWVETDVKLENSYLAKMGKTIEPVIAPLGYDWKMGVGILTSFVAREVFVGTMYTLYSLEDDAPEIKMIDKMRRDTKPNGDKIFTFATGLSILIFYAFAMQCVSTIAVVYKETKSWKWTTLQLVGMSFLAYFSAFIIFQIFR